VADRRRVGVVSKGVCELEESRKNEDDGIYNRRRSAKAQQNKKSGKGKRKKNSKSFQSEAHR
jgi:hypothetical protein